MNGFIISFVSVLATSSATPAPAVQRNDAFAGWTCTVVSLAQQSDERAGRDNNGASTVRVCTK